MKTLFLVAIALVGFNTHAASVPAVSTTHHLDFLLDPSFNVDGDVYYRCEEVQAKFTDLLKALGATDIKVGCVGGIEDYTPAGTWDAGVTADFSTLAPQAGSMMMADYKPVVYNDLDTCALLTELYGKVQKFFSLQNAKATNYCFEASGPFHLTGQSLQAD